MKTRIVLILSLFSATFLTGQNTLSIENKANSFLAGDSIFKYQIIYKAPELSGKGLHWDFSQIEVQNESYLIKYFIPDSTEMNKICGLEHNTHYYYKQEKDSLWSLGFENYCHVSRPKKS